MFSSLLSYSLKPWIIIGRKGRLLAPQGVAGNGCASRVWKEDMAFFKGAARFVAAHVSR